MNLRILLVCCGLFLLPLWASAQAGPAAAALSAGQHMTTDASAIDQDTPEDSSQTEKPAGSKNSHTDSGTPAGAAITAAKGDSDTTGNTATHAGNDTTGTDSGTPADAATQAGGGSTAGTPAGAAITAGQAGTVEDDRHQHHQKSHHRSSPWIVITGGSSEIFASQDDEAENPRDSFVVLGGGHGGPHDAWSLTAEWQPIAPLDKNAIGVGGSFLLLNGSPDDVLDYPAPISQTSPAGEASQKAFAAYLIGSRRVSKQIYVRALVGIGQRDYSPVLQSDVTGWYYRESNRHETSLLLGVGIVMAPGVTLSLDTFRGLSVGWAF